LKLLSKTAAIAASAAVEIVFDFQIRHWQADKQELLLLRICFSIASVNASLLKESKAV
jgi:hypothetical protein